MAKDTGATITSVKIKATADTSSAQKSIKNLADKIASLKQSVGAGMNLPSAKKIEAFGEAMGKLKGIHWTKIANGINNVADALGRISVLKIDNSVIRQMQRIQNEMKNTKSEAKEMEQAVKESGVMQKGSVGRAQQGATSVMGVNTRGGHFVGGQFGNNAMGLRAHYVGGQVGALGGGANAPDWESTSARAKGLGASAQNLAEANATLIKAQVNASRFNAALGVVKTTLNGIKITIATINELLKTATKFVTMLGVKAIVGLGKGLGKAAISPWKKLAINIKDAVKGAANFFTAVKRIAVYRGIRFVLKEISQAFREGIGNLYQYSLLIEGTFAKSMDMLATSALYAKNSLAAMVAPIINELAPAVDYLVDQFVDLLNVVNETLASLTGAETWTKAIKYPTQFAEAADDATGSAKKLRATLLGFDEINRLDDNNKGSRGRAADQLDYSKMFEEKTVSTKAKNYVKVIKDAFKKGDFTKIGETLGENLKKGLDSIRWDDVKSIVERNARSVATLINGFINVPDLGTKIGRTIAEVFNTAVRKMSMFFNTVEWNNVGKFLGDGINGILTTFNTRELGRHIAGVINNGVTLIHNFINTVEWRQFAKFLADGINGFFTDINTKELAATISDVLKKAAGFVVDLLRATDFEKIGEKIGDLIKGLDWTNILSGLATVLFDAVRGAFSLLAGLFESNPLAGTVAGIAIVNAITKFITGTKATSLLGNAILKAVGAGGGAAEATAAVTTTATSGGGGILAALGVSALPVVLSAVAIGAAWTLSQYFWDRESKNRGTTEPYAGAMFDYENDIMKYRMRVFNLEQGRDLDTKLTAAEYQKLLTMPIKGLDSRVGQDSALKEIVTAMDIYGDLVGEYNKKLDTLIDNTAPIKNIKQKVDSLKVTVNINSTTGSGLNQKEQKNFNVVMSAYAQGGIPETGSIFLAGERGAELITSSGGTTSVANRDQIAESVAVGNEESNALLREQNDLLRRLLSKDNTTVITTGQITSALNRANARSGNTVVAVG